MPHIMPSSIASDDSSMSNLPTARYSLNDYDAIEAAVVETERGRWFLTEFSRRNRAADTQMVMTAIERLQDVVSETRSAPVQQDGSHLLIDTLRLDLIEMSHKIADTHTEVAAIGLQDSDPKHAELVSGELDAIVRSTELATSEILEAAEQIQEIAWTMREGGLAVETCDALDARSTNIYLACSFQDLTAQRTTKVIETMRFLENRINKMIGILQGVEGFGIVPVDSHKQTATVSGSQDVFDSLLAQDDVDFALQWNADGSNPDGIDRAFTIDSDVRSHIDMAMYDAELAETEAAAEIFSGMVPEELDADWFDEAEIATTLPSSTTFVDPAKIIMPALAQIVPISSAVEINVDHGKMDEPATHRVSKLDSLDQETLERKLSLFT